MKRRELLMVGGLSLASTQALAKDPPTQGRQYGLRISDGERSISVAARHYPDTKTASYDVRFGNRQETRRITTFEQIGTESGEEVEEMVSGLALTYAKLKGLRGVEKPDALDRIAYQEGIR